VLKVQPRQPPHAVLDPSLRSVRESLSLSQDSSQLSFYYDNQIFVLGSGWPEGATPPGSLSLPELSKLEPAPEEDKTARILPPIYPERWADNAYTVYKSSVPEKKSVSPSPPMRSD
jgi:hypothetical protein